MNPATCPQQILAMLLKNGLVRIQIGLLKAMVRAVKITAAEMQPAIRKMVRRCGFVGWPLQSAAFMPKSDVKKERGSYIDKIIYIYL